MLLISVPLLSSFLTGAALAFSTLPRTPSGTTSFSHYSASRRASAPPIRSIRDVNGRGCRHLFATPEGSNPNGDDEAMLGEKFGGYTVKQRLREEIESPFRQVRLLFFGSSAGSALLALYFSSLSAFKAYAGGYADAPPLNEALTSCGINMGAAIVCGALAYRDYQTGQANLERIARGGKLARLAVRPASDPKSPRMMTDYRRVSRVLIAAGGRDYVGELSRSLNGDQRADENVLPRMLQEADVVVVPVLLERSDGEDTVVGDSKSVWAATQPGEGDRNLDVARADDVVAFPAGFNSWGEYLQSELDTARGQGFDVMVGGVTIAVKKNGRILNRATGLPRWESFVGEAVEVRDGSKFGMPGDSERYGGP